MSGPRRSGLGLELRPRDPDRVLERSPQGLQDLYVGATRATQELVLVQPGGFGPLLSRIRDTVSHDSQELTA